MNRIDGHLLVSLFGGPGCGKTTTAAELFTLLKIQNVETQLIGEFAQECILEGNTDSLRNQVYMFGNTYHRIWSSYRQFKVTITDSPILLSCVYQDKNLPSSFKSLVVDMHCTFENLDILLKRQTTYAHSMIGRVHSREESIQIDERILNLLCSLGIPYITEDSAEGQEFVPFVADKICRFLGK